jgi:hypothetical protein
MPAWWRSGPARASTPSVHNGNGNHTLGDNLENLTITATANPAQHGRHIQYAGISTGASGTGNELANIITGTGADNIIDGRGGTTC